MPRRRRRIKSRAKSVKLSEEVWLRNSKDIQLYRERILEEQGGVCAITQVPLKVGALDHTHKDGCGKEGACRGVLLSEVNMLEGRYLKLFRKLKLEEKYDIDFPEFLISLGEYLKQDNSKSPLHFKYMDDFRKQVKRWRKDTLISKLKEDFNIIADEKLLVSELVQMYMQKWVDQIEQQENSK
tara:strand:- start:8989 stop:9537 length:549 start_codon:yes stop_codon:yes gene_type:complete